MSYARIVFLSVLALMICESLVLAQDPDQQPAPVPQQPPPVSTATPLEKSRAAIAECRERRLRKEFATYRESAECSSPRVFAAWREVNYPHMDLITAWLNARETASAQVDEKKITPAEFERQMVVITNRLTAEEGRRHSGALRVGDNEMQLPPPTQAVGAVTPKGLSKPLPKAGALQYADSSGVGGMGLLSSLDSKPFPAALRPTGTGGPFVPVPGGAGLYAHLASQRSEAEARAVIRSLRQTYANVLGNHDVIIRRANLGSQGAFYRVEVGPLTIEQADELCGNLKAAGGKCVTQYE